jgi:hypothetical protein
MATAVHRAILLQFVGARGLASVARTAVLNSALGIRCICISSRPLFRQKDHTVAVRLPLPPRVGTLRILARPRTALTVRLSLSAIKMTLFPAPAISRS